MHIGIVSGKWLRNGAWYDEGYQALITEETPDGVSWKATRGVAEAVVRTHEQWRTEVNAPFLTERRAKRPELSWDGDTLVVTLPKSGLKEYVEPDNDGLYLMPGRGWTEIRSNDADEVVEGSYGHKFQVGDVIHGFAGGAFGRGSYSCRKVEATSKDWIVTRNESGEPEFLGDMESIFRAWELRDDRYHCKDDGCSFLESD